MVMTDKDHLRCYLGTHLKVVASCCTCHLEKSPRSQDNFCYFSSSYKMERLVGMVPASQAWGNSCLLSCSGGVEARLDLEKCLGGSCNGNSQIGDYTLHWKPISLGSESYGLTLYLSLTLPKQNGTSASELGGLIEMMYVKGRRIVSGTQSALSESEAFFSRPSPFC